MNGALHAQKIVSAPSSVASFSKRLRTEMHLPAQSLRGGTGTLSGSERCKSRRNAFMIGIASAKVQEQGARRRPARGKSRSRGLRASTLLAIVATGFAPSDA